MNTLRHSLLHVAKVSKNCQTPILSILLIFSVDVRVSDIELSFSIQFAAITQPFLLLFTLIYYLNIIIFLHSRTKTINIVIQRLSNWFA